MRKDKEKALSLRKAGKSYATILNELQIPKSTLSDWFRDVDWSKNVRDHLSKRAEFESTKRIRELDRIRGKHLSRAYEEAKTEAAAEMELLKYNPVFVAAIMLYWGEGDKLTRHSVKLTNTDQKMIQLFIFFLQKIRRVPDTKIKLHILLYPDLDIQVCEMYWQQTSGLPKENFTKSTVIVGKHKTRRLSFGICMVTVSSTYMKVKMLEWIRLLPEALMDRRYYENI